MSNKYHEAVRIAYLASEARYHRHMSAIQKALAEAGVGPLEIMETAPKGEVIPLGVSEVSGLWPEVETTAYIKGITHE